MSNLKIETFKRPLSDENRDSMVIVDVFLDTKLFKSVGLYSEDGLKILKWQASQW